MHLTIKLFFIITFSFWSWALIGQDYIELNNGKVLENVSIQSMDDEKVFYFENNDSLIIYSIYQSQISFIERNIKNSKPKIPNDHKNQIKIEIFGLTFNSYSFGYERSIYSGVTIEGYFSFRNGELRDGDRFNGYEGGVRFKSYLSQSRIKKEATNDIFQGAYSFIILGYGNQKENLTPYNFITMTDDKFTITRKAIFGGIGLGHQIQFKNFSFDGNASYIYYNGTKEETSDSQPVMSSKLDRYDNGAIIDIGKGGLFVSFSLGVQF